MPGPKVDPMLVAARTHLTRLRAELDRADAAIAEYEGAGRERIATALLMLRGMVDETELRIDAEAAGR